MKGYWLRIGLGAFAIFVVGMVIMGASRRGISKVKEAFVNQSISLGGDGAPFRLMGRQLGTLSRVDLTPVARDGIPHVKLRVTLDPGVSVVDLTDCNLVAGEASPSRPVDGLRCLDSSEVGSGRFVEVGEVNLEPGGETLRLFVPESTMEQDNWLRLFQGVRAPRVTAAPGHRPSVQLEADSSKAFLMIRDEHGKPVFQLNADSNGAFIQVRDSNGQEVVRFQADSKGVKGTIGSH